MLTVCSSDADEPRENQKSLFSNYSSQYVEMCAPGAIDSTLTGNPQNPRQLTPLGVLSTVIMNTPVTIRGQARTTNYWFMAGTSMASPIVAGASIAAISYAKSLNLHLTPAQLEHYMKLSSMKLSSLKTYAQDGNHLDMTGLVTCIKAVAEGG